MRIHDYMKIIEKLPLGKPNLAKKEELTESEKMQDELEPIDEDCRGGSKTERSLLALP